MGYCSRTVFGKVPVFENACFKVFHSIIKSLSMITVSRDVALCKMIEVCKIRVEDGGTGT